MLVGNRVILRPFRRSDLEGLYDLVSDVREIGEFWPLGCISEPRWFKQFDEMQWWSGEFKILLITDLDGRRLGQINVYKASHSYEGWELGYRIYRPEDRGKGYTTEAVRLCTAYLFGQESIERMQILLDPRNIGSQKVAEGAGYTLEGTLRHAHFDRGEHHDLLQFSIVRSEVTPLSELLAPLDD
ncbi:GNAT family N-acetyltransferase [Candidatus Bipolaricaulota bacterium]